MYCGLGYLRLAAQPLDPPDREAAQAQAVVRRHVSRSDPDATRSCRKATATAARLNGDLCIGPSHSHTHWSFAHAALYDVNCYADLRY